ncbi:MAG TPA: CHRD domain-containing protein, partial [Burkholderiaceae bacterium]|nr:CHRD domain-containing protein [Burkholderiaceae bacterium]
MFHSTSLMRIGLTATLVTLGACSTTSKSPTAASAPIAYGRTLLTVVAQLTGDQEVPYNEGNGFGQLKGTFDPRTRVLKWRIVYSSLSGPATMAHFHGPAARGKNAGVVLPFPNPASPIVGQATLTEAQAKDLLKGLWYANVHTLLQSG